MPFARVCAGTGCQLHRSRNSGLRRLGKSFLGRAEGLHRGCPRFAPADLNLVRLIVMWTWKLLDTKQVLWSFGEESGSVCPAEGFVWRRARFSRIVSCWANDRVPHDIAQGSIIGEAASRRAEALMLFSPGWHIKGGIFLSNRVCSRASLLCKMRFTLQMHLLFPIFSFSINCQLF